MALAKHLLVPTDFSEPSTAALEHAITLAKAIGAKITIAHIYEVPSFAYEGGLVSVPVEFATKIRDAAVASLKAACDANAGRGVEISSLAREGVPAELIDEIAKELGADMIVMGTHGRRGLSHVLLGSVAERVLRTARVPVLTVHAKKVS